MGVPPLAMVDDLVCISTCGLNSVKMNAFINSKTNIKKLQFGLSKCHKMHVGPTKACCPDLELDNWKVKNVEDIETGEKTLNDEFDGPKRLEESEVEKYLGDLISKDGSNIKNIMARKAKGTGIVDQIMGKLRGTVYGPFYFEVGLILREAMLVNGILTNAEAWYGLTDSEIELLEQVDEQFLRIFLEVGKGCPKEMLYLETGTIPLRFTIYKRRLMYLHYLLNENANSLISKFLKIQMEIPSKQDWINSVEKDLVFLDIFLSYDDIKELSTIQFKSFLDKIIEAKALEHLNNIKLKHSKVLHIRHDSLCMQPYLSPKNAWDNQLSKFLFQARTRMLDLRANFKMKHVKTGLACELGCGEEESQEHLLVCKKIPESSITGKTVPKYEDLFEIEVDKQMKMAAILKERFLKRKDLLKQK